MSDLFGGEPPRKNSGKSKKLGSQEDADRVWAAWVARQPKPDRCRYTDDRRKLLRERLGLGYEADDLVALVRYAYEADERAPRWWRGDNEDSATYLDLTSLLRIEKLGPRVTAALTWCDTHPPGTIPVPTQEPTRPRGLQLIQGGRAVHR